MAGEEKRDISLERFTKLFKENTLKILAVLKDEERLKWKDIQDKTRLPVATLNRSLAILRDLYIIMKDDEMYRLTWIGELILDGMNLFGLKLGESAQGVNEDEAITERSIARDVALISLIMLLAGLRKRGRLDIKEFEGALDREKKIFYKIIGGFQEEGLVKFDGRIVEATDQLREMKLMDILSL